MIQIEEIQTDYGIILVYKSADSGALMYDVDGCHQSSADGKGISLASYIHAIYGLLVQAKARNVLLVGCGGGTLGTMLSRARRKTTMIDVNPASFDVARKYFALPDAVICHVAEAEAFLTRETATYDAVVLDAFHGEDIPTHLQSPQFFALVRERLTPGGAVFANIRVKHDFDDHADRVAKNMKSVWGEVRVLDTQGVVYRNAIVMAGHVSRLREPDFLVRPEMNSQGIENELRRLRFRPWKVSRWDFGG